jgi:glycosyltransferase involved in cell wall biosynthesis
MPWLSVIVPTYNGGDFLGAALESVVAQRDDDIEVILVDDGSTDDTLAIAESFRTRLPLRIIAHEDHRNWVACTNDGMSLAAGEYVGWLHQDDAWDDRRAAVLRELTHRHPGADLIAHAVWFMDSVGRKVSKWRSPLQPGRLLVPRDVIPRLLVQDFFASTGTIFKASAALRVGRLDERLWFFADWDFWLKVTGSGDTVYYDEPLSLFRVHDRSQTMSRAREGFAWQYEVIFDRHFPRWEPELENIAAIRRAAQFSADVNVAFARWAGGGRGGIPSLLAQFVMLGPHGWRRYFRDSRILERVISRVRAGILPTQRAAGNAGRRRFSATSELLKDHNPASLLRR